MVKKINVYNTKIYVTEEGFVFNDKECTSPRTGIYQNGHWYIDFGDMIPLLVESVVFFAFGNCSHFNMFGISHIDGNTANNHINNLIRLKNI